MPRRQSKFLFACARLARETTHRNPKTDSTLRFRPLGALLLTLVLLFGLQGEQITRQPAVIAMLAVPILIQVYFNAGLAYLVNRRLGVAWCVAGPSALIGASNFFELAVATARWPVITALGFTQIFAWGSSYFLRAVLAAPIAANTGWSLGWAIGGLSLGLLAGA